MLTLCAKPYQAGTRFTTPAWMSDDTRLNTLRLRPKRSIFTSDSANAAGAAQALLMRECDRREYR